MSKKLLIVESPAKAVTIGKYLGGDFTVKSSVGHIRDLPKKGLSIKIAPVEGREGAWTFTPSYEVSAEKKKVVDDLRKAARAADEVFLAPDPDREGEAIAWHLSQVLADVTKGKPVRRVTYNEITKKAVQTAVANPGEINLARVDAQQARRILDRLVGFKVSPLLWKNLQYGYSLSAGRVQSVALRLLVEREREITGFNPVAYWVLGVEASKGTKETAFIAKLARLDDVKPNVRSQEQAATLVDDLDGAGLRVTSVKEQPKTRHPYPPFTTSTLQQAASSVCGFSPQRTMSMAQKLYEAGLITYMRTDSVNVAAEARAAAKDLIESEFGAAFVPEKPNFYKSKAGAQEAHEAIRPTDVRLHPAEAGLDAASTKLYDLIWRRFVASQMAEARLVQKTVALEAEKDALRHSYLFTASTTSVEFEGFLAAMKTAKKAKAAEEEDEDSDEVKSLPPLAVGEALTPVRWLSDRKETKPPPRYSEASLVKALEENGVGRPSTYAQTIEVLVDRLYATREARQLVPTQRGMDVNDWLVKKIEPLFNVGYTAKMEGELDKVEEGEEQGNDMLSGFYRQFTAWVRDAQDPPPPIEKFNALFELLDEVKNWRPPMTIGKRTFGDKEFVDSVRQQIADGKTPCLPIGILVRREDVKLLFMPVVHRMAEDGASVHISLEIQVRDRGAASLGHHLVPELVGERTVHDDDILVAPGTLPRRQGVILGDAAQQFPVPGMGIQEHHRRGPVVEGVELVDVVDLADILPDKPLPAPLTPATGKPHHLGDNLAEMVVELAIDILDEVIVLVGETAGHIREDNVGPIAEHVTHQPGDEASPGIMVC